MPGVARAVAINGTCVLVKVLASQPAWWGEQLVVKLITGLVLVQTVVSTVGLATIGKIGNMAAAMSVFFAALGGACFALHRGPNCVYFMRGV